MSFGEQLSSVRRRSGLTQEQFAEQLQVSRQAVSKWESGRGCCGVTGGVYGTAGCAGGGASSANMSAMDT